MYKLLISSMISVRRTYHCFKLQEFNDWMRMMCTTRFKKLFVWSRNLSKMLLDRRAGSEIISSNNYSLFTNRSKHQQCNARDESCSSVVRPISPPSVTLLTRNCLKPISSIGMSILCFDGMKLLAYLRKVYDALIWIIEPLICSKSPVLYFRGFLFLSIDKWRQFLELSRSSILLIQSSFFNWS